MFSCGLFILIAGQKSVNIKLYAARTSRKNTQIIHSDYFRRAGANGSAPD
jgi:hypothetical protein